MELPKSIRVGASYYEVRKERMSEDMGNCDHSHFIIRISNDLSRENTVSTFLHEVLHAMASEYNANIPSRAEESMVRSIENGLKGFAKDHNALLHTLIDELAQQPVDSNNSSE
jgi:hypothetical protein